VLLGKAEKLLFEDVFELLDTGRSQATHHGIGQISIDGHFDRGQQPCFFDFVSTDRCDLIFGRDFRLAPRSASLRKYAYYRESCPRSTSSSGSERQVGLSFFGIWRSVWCKRSTQCQQASTCTKNRTNCRSKILPRFIAMILLTLEFGGGGGSRTRVRKSFQQRAFMLFPVHFCLVIDT